MWKDFFYFSKSDRIAIIILIGWIVIIGGGVTIYSFFKKPFIDEAEISMKEYDDFIASVHEKDSLRASQYSYYRKKQIIELIPFDPNVVDSAFFVQLGLKPFIARNIIHYRAKGGKFRTPESFAKIYGITDQQFKTLLPYIFIGEEFVIRKDTLYFKTQGNSKDSLKYFKYPEGTILDINSVDTTELKKVPGIGSAIAKGIIAYRTRLGGYYRVSQLQDLSYVSDTLNRWFGVKSMPAHRLDLNKSSIERLMAHPYINFYQAKIIVEYRKKKGKLTTLDKLALYDEFTQKDMERIKPYVCF